MASSLSKVARASVKASSARRPAGFRILVPGYAQWTWSQRERAMVLFGTFAAALAVAIFAWGSKPGLAMLGCAFAMHVASTADVIRQGAFPGFGRWVPGLSATFGLGLGCYMPTLVLASAFAWPDHREGYSQDAYLINRWAFRDEGPRTGDWVWFRTARGFGIGQVVAGPGQQVECRENTLRIEGQRLLWNTKDRGKLNLDLSLAVPDGQYLIVPLAGTPGTTTAAGMTLIPRENIVGRPWAQVYPVRKRHFLF